jgi:hypothetical protein
MQSTKKQITRYLIACCLNAVQLQSEVITVLVLGYFWKTALIVEASLTGDYVPACV